MIGKMKWLHTLLLTAFLAVALIGIAAAHGDRRPSQGSVKPARPVHALGLLRQLVYPCLSSCGETAKACHDAADDAALSCTAAACATEVGAAQTACAEDSRATACIAAISALRDCAEDCLDTRNTAVSACRTALAECADACDTAD